MNHGCLPAKVSENTEFDDRESESLDIKLGEF
jgi:hypothetical protein